MRFSPKAKLLILFLGMCTISFSAFGEESRAHSFDKLRSQKKEIKEFVEMLIQRRIQNHLVRSMQTQGFREGQIETLLQSQKVKNFFHNISRHPKIQTSVDAVLDRVLKPGVLEKAYAKRRQKRLEDHRQALNQTLSELMSQRPWAIRNAEAKSPGLLKELWGVMDRWIF